MWIAVAGAPFLLLLAGIAMLWTAQGDFLHHPSRPLFGSRLSLEPLPVWRFTNSGSPSPGGHYYAGLGSFVLVSNPNDRMDWKQAWEERRRFKSVGGDYYVPDVPGAAAAGAISAWNGIERYPPGALEGLRAAWRSESEAAALVEAEKLRRAFPDRVAPKYWVVSLTAQRGQLAEAERLLQQWRPDFEAASERGGLDIIRWLESDLAACQPAGAELRRAIQELFPDSALRAAPSSSPSGSGASPRPGGLVATFTVEQWLERVEALEIDHLPVSPSLWVGAADDYLSRHRMLGALAAHAMFSAVDGDFGRALSLLEKGWLLAYSPKNPDGGRGRPVDHGTRMLERLGWLLLDSNLSESDLAKGWAALERMAAANPPRDMKTILENYQFPGGAPTPVETRSRLAAGDRLMGTLAGFAIRKARLQLLREGLRVRHYRAKHGAWPAIDAEGFPIGLELETSGPPIVDPFVDPPRPFRAKIDGARFILHSEGPDGNDDGLATNLWGDVLESQLGDVFLALEAEPRCDFPSDPGHEYADYAEFQRRYPSGFPATELGGRRVGSSGSAMPAPGAKFALSVDPATGKAVVIEPMFDFFGAPMDGLVSPDPPDPVFDPRAGFDGIGGYRRELRVADPTSIPTAQAMYGRLFGTSTPLPSLPPSPPSKWTRVKYKTKAKPEEAAAEPAGGGGAPVPEANAPSVEGASAAGASEP